MADNSSGMGLIGVIVGALLVILVVIYAFGGFKGTSKPTTVNINPPAVSGSK